MLEYWKNRAYVKAMTGIRRVLNDEKGDTNFISILIILGIVILLAGVFMKFKDQIIAMVQEIIDNFVAGGIH